MRLPRTYKPDHWEIIRIKTPTDIIFKVLGNWSGGYLDGDSWRASSGIESFSLKDNCYIFENFSGSEYICHKDMKGLGSMTYGVYSKWQKELESMDDHEITIVSVENMEKELESIEKTNKDQEEDV